ncbi:MAG: hypothetical protein M3Z35_17190 [Nitrospirota bacterium]|nr:hypothetical protein [Nitrospirota bacterium]
MKDQPHASPDDREFERQSDTLLLYLKRTRGIDLRGYKRPSLMRRITRRMESVKIEGGRAVHRLSGGTSGGVRAAL